jgi:Aminoglycoside-2''-adenylyltransferase
VSDSDQLAALSHLHQRFEAEGVEYWLFGGWAVDFHAGALTRLHGDLDLAIWFRDFPRVRQLLSHDGCAQEEGAEEGSATFARGAVSLELAFLQRDDDDSEPYTPLRDAQRATWAGGAFGQDVLSCAVSAPVSSR